MSKQFTMKTHDDLSETPITQADITSGQLKLVKRNASGAVVQSKQLISIF